MKNYFSARQVAQILEVSTQTLSRWRDEGAGPPSNKVGTGNGATFQYDDKSLKAFIERHGDHMVTVAQNKKERMRRLFDMAVMARRDGEQ